MKPEFTRETPRQSESDRLRVVVGMIALTLAVTVVLTLISTTLNHLAERGTNFEVGRTSWFDTMRMYAPNWLLWAVLAPIVFAITIKLADARISRISWLLSHLFLCAIFAVTYSALIVPIRVAVLAGMGTTFSGDWLGNIKSVLLFRGIVDALFYWGLVGGVHAYRYRRRLRAESERAEKLQRQLAEARLAALQSQIQPHFLFNTLNSIAALIRLRDVDRALEMLGVLSELLRRTLRESVRPWLPLSEELELAELYLSIEQVRFADRLQVNLDTDPAAANIRVPAFLLQPIVENSVRYGIVPNPGPGRIDIITRRRDASVLVDISNTGTANGRGGASIGGQGMGLENVRQRLMEAYGVTATFQLETRPDGSADARLVLPIEPRLATGITDDQ